MLRRCKWCGRTFEGKTKRANYCSERCRKAHNRAYRDGIRLKLPTDPPGEPDPSVSEADIARAVVGSRGMVAFFDSASVNGPENRRELCRHISVRFDAALREVGL